MKETTRDAPAPDPQGVPFTLLLVAFTYFWRMVHPGKPKDADWYRRRRRLKIVCLAIIYSIVIMCFIVWWAAP